MSRMDVNFGADVLCTDGKCGTLARVAVKPETWQVTLLIVEEGLLLKRARVFPFAAIVDVTPFEVRLDLDSGSLADYPLYHMEVVETPVPEQNAASVSEFWREGVPYGVGAPLPPPVVTERVHHGVPAEMVVVDRHTSVEGTDGELGKVDRLLVDGDSGVITDIVVQQGVLLMTRRALPATMGKSISEKTIYVSAAAGELDGLPAYEAESSELEADGNGRVDEVDERAPLAPKEERWN